MLLLEPSPAGGEPCGDGSAGESKEGAGESSRAGEEVPKDVRLSSCAASSVAALTIKLDVVRKCVGRRSTGLESPSCAMLQPSARRIGRTGSSPEAIESRRPYRSAINGSPTFSGTRSTADSASRGRRCACLACKRGWARICRGGGRARAESLQGSRPDTSPDGGYRRQALAASHIQKRTSQPPGA